MKKSIRFSCPMDCFDVCGLVADVKDGNVIRIRGDADHPVTRGRVCVKGKKILERTFHPQRLRHPMKHVKSGWKTIGWNEALDLFAEKLENARDSHGSASVLNWSGSAYNGIGKTVDKVFFNHFGGVTVPRGSLCWGAGIAAQKYDFGNALGHAPEDIVNSKTIFIWGRNPVATNPHIVPFFKEAKKNGTVIVLIDPIRTESAAIVDKYVSIRPGTDAALAFGMALEIIRSGKADVDFIRDHVIGFEPFRDYASEFTLKKAEAITGIPREEIRWLADRYAENKPSAIWLGQGMQRCKNGGNAVRAVDALAAITGNIGIRGGGVNFANKVFPAFIGGEVKRSMAFAANMRTFVAGKFGTFIREADNPPIQVAYISKVNPLSQLPNVHSAIAAFRKIPFKVVVDMFLTDTASEADLVLPCTSVLEEEDIVFGSMFSPYMNYSNQVVGAPRQVMSEFDLFRGLARKLGLSEYPDIEKTEYLRRAIAPITESYGADLSDLRKKPFKIPGSEIPWKNKKFSTPSGKIEILSKRAEKECGNAIPVFIPPKRPRSHHDIRLITAHHRSSIHSQHFVFEDRQPMVYLNEKTIRERRLKEGRSVRVESEHGSIRAIVKKKDGIQPGQALIYQGFSHAAGSVNALTSDGLSDMGEQVTYYDTFCSFS